MFCSSGWAQTAEQNLGALLQTYHSLSAKFVETTEDTHGQVLQKTLGDMAFQKPSLFRWYTQTPSRQLIINQGDKLAIYDVDLEQVTYKNVDEGQGATPAILLSGDIAALKKQYTITGTVKGKSQSYRLMAKDEDNEFKQIDLRFDNEVLISMIISNNMDQITRIQFQNPKINSSLEPNLFALNLPADVDVVQ